MSAGVLLMFSAGCFSRAGKATVSELNFQLDGQAKQAE